MKSSCIEYAVVAALAVLLVVGCWARNGAPLITWEEWAYAVLAIVTTFVACAVVFPILTLLHGAFRGIQGRIDDRDEREEHTPQTSVRVIYPKK